MFFQSAILALLLACSLAVAALLGAAPFALQLVLRWNLQSAKRLQLRLERRTYLLSTLVVWVLCLQMACMVLFVFNAQRMAEQFVGAMCAVGTLRVNAWGFAALYAQMAVFFLAAIWLSLNRADTLSPHYPLTRLKFALLPAVLLPAAAISAVLQWQYFANLRADIITSCCGSLFSAGAATLGGDLAALPPRPALLAFVVALTLAILANLRVALRAGRGALFAGLCSAVAFVVALAGIVSFLSLYIYEHPHHHCPFCILEPEYGYRGWALYLPLFGAAATGLGAGALALVGHVPALRSIAPALAQRMAWWAAGGFTLFLLLSLGMIWRSRLVLF